MNFTLLQAGARGKIVYPSAIVVGGGASFVFNYPHEFPGFRLQRYGKDTLSGAGVQQSMTQFIDVQFDFGVPFIPPAMVTVWFNFLMSALQRTPFDLYPDSTKTGYLTCLLMQDEVGADHQGPGLYEIRTLKLRVLITAAP